MESEIFWNKPAVSVYKYTQSRKPFQKNIASDGFASDGPIFWSECPFSPPDLPKSTDSQESPKGTSRMRNEPNMLEAGRTLHLPSNPDIRYYRRRGWKFSALSRGVEKLADGSRPAIIDCE
jgi:hypothetical protein